MLVAEGLYSYNINSGDFMSEIRYFNSQLNNSFKKRSSTKVNFRDQVDVFLKSSMIKSSNFRQALIIGAGKMDDFSLAFFIKYMDKVVISDVDIETTKKAVDALKLKKSERQKIVLREIEYTGFQFGGFFIEFSRDVLKLKTHDEIDSFINGKLEPIKKYQFLEYDVGKYDFIYISPIYTQLVYNQLMMECSLIRQSGYPEHLIKYIEQVMLEEMIGVIDRFNDNVVRLMSDKARLFVLSDVFEVNVGSDFDLRIMSGIKNKEVMDKIYQSYSKQYGMGLGDYGLYNLDEKMEENLTKWLVWPFKEETNLIVKLKNYIKKEIILEEV